MLNNTVERVQLCMRATYLTNFFLTDMRELIMIIAILVSHEDMIICCFVLLRTLMNKILHE